MTSPKALVFDVQGTATDFHTTVRTAAADIDSGRHPDVDWSAFVNQWRAQYFQRTASVAGPRWVSVHSIYRAALDELLDARGITMSEPHRAELTGSWQRLQPWPDAVEGLNRLRGTFLVATLSNADVAAVVRLSKRAGLQWDAIFTAEMANAFKPDPSTYRMAAGYLGVEPNEMMMVASHKYDLRAAATLGCRTAFVARPLEFGADTEADTAYENEFDINAADFLDLANQLGC